ncbi:MAG: HPr family phosphocarrier protein [Ruminococcaceae bacterium]|nr:HPr family phosphocarrier protein [Oscillospiraceae bacterium]
MRECKIKLDSISDVKEFVGIVCGYTFEVDLQSGRYSVDAKSIMGIFSLDLGKTLEMKVHSDGEDAENFLDDVKKFVVA